MICLGFPKALFAVIVEKIGFSGTLLNRESGYLINRNHCLLKGCASKLL